MGHLKKIIAFRVTRFGLAGAANTAANFAILNFVFYVLHQNKLVASFIATSCAVALSFVLNRSFVFVDNTRPLQKLARFIGITAGGVLLIQNSVYVIGLALLHNHEVDVINAAYSFTGIRLGNDFVDVNLSNLIASFVVMFWNYNGYKLFVFNSKRRGIEVIEDISTEAV